MIRKIKTFTIIGLGMVSALTVAYGIITRLHLNASKLEVEKLQTEIEGLEVVNQQNQTTIQYLLDNDSINREYRRELKNKLDTLEGSFDEKSNAAIQAIPEMDYNCLDRDHPIEFRGLFQSQIHL